MNRLIIAVIAVVISSLFAGRANAQINIRRTSDSGIITFDPSQPVDTPFTVSVGESDREIRVYATNPSTQSIGRITIIGGGSTPIEVVIGNSPFTTGVGGVNPAFPGGLNWRGLFVSGASVSLIARINGSLLDSVTASQIYQMNLSVIQAEVRRSGNNSGFRVLFGSMFSSGSIVANGGTIALVDAMGDVNGLIEATTGSILDIRSTGSIRGDIRAPQGSIRTIETTTGGSISRLPDSPTNRLQIVAMDGIDSIVASSIRANITANSLGSGTISLIRTTAGNLVGSVVASGLNSTSAGVGLRITGDLEADVQISGSVAVPILVSGSVQNGGRITISGPLQNANDAEIDITGSLDGDVSVGEISRRVRVSGSVLSSRSLSIGTVNNVSSSAVMVSGAVAGSVSVNGSVNAISSIGGSVSGSVTVSGALSSLFTLSQPVSGAVTLGSITSVGTLACSSGVNSSGVISIGGSHAGSLIFGTSGNPGLAGQVLINTNAGTGDWTGSVRVGGASGALLSPIRYYSNTAASVGDGAVGLAPFHLYNADCSLASDAYIDRALFNASGITLRWYGPVALASGDPRDAITIERAEPYQPSIWMPVGGSELGFVNVSVNPSGVAGAARAIRIDDNPAHPLAPGRYRVKRVSGRLVCAGVQGLPSVFDEYFYFRLGHDCNGVNGVTAADFFAGALDGSMNCDMHPDCNCNGISDVCDTTIGGFADADENQVPDCCNSDCPCD